MCSNDMGRLSIDVDRLSNDVVTIERVCSVLLYCFKARKEVDALLK